MSDNAVSLEDGFAAFDMKEKMLWTSDKVRISKDGKRYLIIPFGHGTPGSKSKRAMPNFVYEKAETLRRSVITGHQNEGVVKRNTYKWGGSLGDSGITTEGKSVKYLKGDSGKLEPHKITPKEYDIYKGMVRFQKNPNIVRHGVNLGKFAGSNRNISSSMQNYSSYMTFRVMSEDSPGWQHPGMKAMNILGETVERIEGRIIQMLKESVTKKI